MTVMTDKSAATKGDRPTGESGLNETSLSEGAIATLRRGLALAPEFRRGLALTLLLALVATAGRTVVPIAVQQTIDHGLPMGGSPDLGYVRNAVLICAVVTVLTALSAYLMNVRLYKRTEGSLATLRVKAFRHVHDLSMLTQSGQRRGGLVSRVTGDVDQISQFMQWGGLMLLISVGEVAVVTALMAVYSWQLTLVVWIAFLPLAFALRFFQRLISRAYMTVRERMGDLLAAVSESVVGAPVIKAHAAERRTADRVDLAVERGRAAQKRAQGLVAMTFPSSEIVAAIATAAVVVGGVMLGVGGGISAGELVAFLFLVTLFVSPMQQATEILNEAQNAIAGWRRVLGVLDTEPDVADPGEDGHVLPRGPVEVRFSDVAFAYPSGPRVLDGVDVRIPPRARIAVVGETGSGKTTFAKLLTRLMDPAEGTVLVDGVPLDRVRFSSLRERIVIVPQDGFLFDTTLGENIRYGRPSATDAEITEALGALGLADWLESLPRGLDTPVGQRGESLSAGERQLAALARAYLADPDLLVLDEATSAVDPATEVRIQRALDGITRGRTSVTIAHRLSTAEAADEVLVFDKGRIVQRGHHEALVATPGVYADLHRSWRAQRSL
ncbi:ABC transporter ATP-binding protein [Actinocorallia sp. A-T 12471]|uniref:ABC transporter ATP-binding protein n=1 Tax=Actinocorallia sp. A-T 12471 TaxID=3089813 RepID=UPI0029CB49C0|nr:ABC transporter ATP-binding protein [Actinocorallia sp. A-T 12471]MDX6743034.1 ABC transporter ATP-binding protein [Actinocorallia sp. A-T 12471]